MEEFKDIRGEFTDIWAFTYLPTCLATGWDFFWCINLYVINAKFKVVDHRY